MAFLKAFQKGRRYKEKKEIATDRAQPRGLFAKKRDLGHAPSKEKQLETSRHNQIVLPRGAAACHRAAARRPCPFPRPCAAGAAASRRLDCHCVFHRLSPHLDGGRPKAGARRHSRHGAGRRAQRRLLPGAPDGRRLLQLLGLPLGEVADRHGGQKPRLGPACLSD